MNTALTVPLADSWGMHGNGGWWLLAAIPMMRGMMGGGSSPDSSTPPDRSVSRETPLETLERRFAEGEISIEEYRGASRRSR